MIARIASGLWAILLCCSPLATATAADYRESPLTAAAVAKGELAPVAERLPDAPLVVPAEGREPGEYGGVLRILMARSRDTRQMVVYGYTRLVVYDEDLKLVPDLLESFESEGGKVFTLHLRKGLKWSDGHPFTSEDFRYFWEDVANNPTISPVGPPATLLVRGEAAKVEVLDDHTIRYSWSGPNPTFLPALAGATPLYIYRPAHYLRQFHEKYADAGDLKKKVAEKGQRDWAALHHVMDEMYKNDNPDMPSLDPWVVRTSPPAERFIFERNPYYHRVDAEGRQLPYIDRVVMGIADGKLIPAKAGTGEADLQARYISFDDYSFLKQNEEQYGFKSNLWRTAKGAHLALYPNLNASDPVWRALLRDARVRRALSLGINRKEINDVIYFGLALEANDTVLPECPLFKPEYQTRWATFDPDQANRLLDEAGLGERNSQGFRKLPDGRTMEVIVETAESGTEQADVLGLVGESWRQIGVKLFIKPLQQEVFRNRIFAGETIMSIRSGLENGLATEDLSPAELAPTAQIQYQWPKWGQYHETAGQAGEPIDMDKPRRLFELNEAWTQASSSQERRKIWDEMLEIWSDQTFTIGIVSGTLQPVVVANSLANVPAEGMWNWDPGAHFGLYRPDTFYFADAKRRAETAPN